MNSQLRICEACGVFFRPDYNLTRERVNNLDPLERINAVYDLCWDHAGETHLPLS